MKHNLKPFKYAVNSNKCSHRLPSLDLNNTSKIKNTCPNIWTGISHILELIYLDSANNTNITVLVVFPYELETLLFCQLVSP